MSRVIKKVESNSQSIMDIRSEFKNASFRFFDNEGWSLTRVPFVHEVPARYEAVEYTYVEEDGISTYSKTDVYMYMK